MKGRNTRIPLSKLRRATAGYVQSPESISAHLADPDPHSEYLTELEADALYSDTGHTHTGLVTNGDSHDHSGGDGAQIAYAGLSGLPTLGTAAAENVGYFEPTLGNPGSNGYVLSSLTDGTRSWISAGGGSGLTHPQILARGLGA